MVELVRPMRIREVELSWSLGYPGAPRNTGELDCLYRHSDALVRSVDLRAKFTKMALNYTVGFCGELLQIRIGT